MHTIVGSATSAAALAAVLAIATAGLGAQTGAGQPPASARPRVQASTSPKILDARLAQAKAESARLATEQRTLLTRLRQIELAVDTKEMEREKTELPSRGSMCIFSKALTIPEKEPSRSSGEEPGHHSTL